MASEPKAAKCSLALAKLMVVQIVQTGELVEGGLADGQAEIEFLDRTARDDFAGRSGRAGVDGFPALARLLALCTGLCQAILRRLVTGASAKQSDCGGEKR